MWLEEADGFAEIFKGYLPYYLLVALPIFIIISPINPVTASHEFSVNRMQQYDLYTVPHGCRSSGFNLEGRSLKSWSSFRHCLVAHIQQMTIEKFLEIRNKAGALLLVLPKNTTNLSNEEKEHIRLLEMAMTQQEVNSPVYFAHWTQELDNIVRDLQHGIVTDDKSGTALEAMFKTVSSNGYQIVVTAPAPPKLDFKPATIHGRLVGRSARTIVITAHYDSSAIVPELSYGADANGSGVVALMELLRVFSRLYSVAETRGAPTLVFMVTSTGPTLNYFATKKWLEELDSTDATLLQDVSFVMCLDSISSSPLLMHVSKPPKAGGAVHSIQSRLGVEYVHKKINLADEVLAWHHERFSIRRLAAFTLSSSKNHKGRGSILDTPSEFALNNLVSNVRQVARGLASYVYNLTDEDSKEDAVIYDEALSIDEQSIRQWYRYITSQPRSPQTIAISNGLTGTLERAFSKYTEATKVLHQVDKREPEFTLYGQTKAQLFVYSVKPAVFDLVLTLAIVAYLGVVYLAVQTFPTFYSEYAGIIVGKTKDN